LTSSGESISSHQATRCLAGLHWCLHEQLGSHVTVMEDQAFSQLAHE